MSSDDIISEQAAEIDLAAIKARAEAWMGDDLEHTQAITKAARVLGTDIPALVAEVEQLRTAPTREQATSTRDRTRLALRAKESDDARRERDEARAALGAVAALATRYRTLYGGMRQMRYILDELDAVLAPVSGAVAKRCLNSMADPLGAVAKHEQEVRAADVQRRLVAEWHADQCGCKEFATDGDGDLSECASRATGFDMRNPQSWTVEEVLAARADALTEGQAS